MGRQRHYLKHPPFKLNGNQNRWIIDCYNYIYSLTSEKHPPKCSKKKTNLLRVVGVAITGPVALENDALYRRVEQGAHCLNGDAGEEPQQAHVAVQRRLHFKLVDCHRTEDRARIHCQNPSIHPSIHPSIQ